ncbi:MAG: tetratricopeptide repeat protein, partial [Bacillota bacterium]
QAYDLDSGNQNIKDYIMECENNQSTSKFFNLDKLDLSRFNLNKLKISKYKKELTALITALLAVFLIFILSNGQPLELIERTEVADNTTQNEAANSGADENNTQAQNDKANNSAAEKPENNLNQLGLDLNIMEYQGLSNLVSLDLIRNIKNKESEKKQAEVFEQYFDEEREQELFNLGLQSFRNQRYEEAGIIFKQLYQLSEAEYLKRESLYLLARGSQLDDDFEAAEKYYRLYIDNYPDTNYYEEALYTLGLLLDEQGKLVEAKEVLQELRREKPYSSYNNSKVYDILNKDS